MGVTHLQQIVEGHSATNVKYIHLDQLADSVVALDMSHIIYRIKRFCITTHSANPNEQLLLELINLLLKFIKAKIAIICVFDGKPSQKKDRILNTRKKQRDNAKQKLEIMDSSFEKEPKQCKLALTSDDKDSDHSIDFSMQVVPDIPDIPDMQVVPDIPIGIDDCATTRINLKKRAMGIKYNDSKSIMELLSKLHIPYVYDKYIEADKILKHLNDCKVVQYIYTHDMDLLAMGCNMILDLDYNTDYIKLYDYNLIIDNMNLKPEQMTEFCICLGTDYSGGLRHISNDTLLALYQTYGTLSSIINCQMLNETNFPNNFNYNDAYEFFTDKIQFDLYTQINHFEFIKPSCELLVKSHFALLTNMTDINTNLIDKIIDTKKKIKYKKKLCEFYISRYGIVVF